MRALRRTGTLLALAALIAALAGCLDASPGAGPAPDPRVFTGEGNRTEPVGPMDTGLWTFLVANPDGGHVKAGLLASDSAFNVLIANVTQDPFADWAAPALSDVDYTLAVIADGRWAVTLEPVPRGTGSDNRSFEGEDRDASEPFGLDEARYEVELTAQDRGDPLWADVLDWRGIEVATMSDPDAEGQRFAPTPRTERATFDARAGAHVLRVGGEGTWSVAIEEVER